MVVLPHPDGPNKTKNVPELISTEKLVTALTIP
jgi:hypothetical protein